MDWKTITKINENPGKQWYYTVSELTVMLGRNRNLVSQFLQEKSIPWYQLGDGKNKSYFLPEVIEAVEKTRWKQA